MPVSISSKATLPNQQRLFKGSQATAQSQPNASLASKLSRNILSVAENGPFSGLPDKVKAELKEGLQVAETLKKAAENSDDGERSYKISQIKERIKQLKEKLKFATPEQAKRLAKELKQLGQDFKEAARSLSGGSASITNISAAQTNLSISTGAAAADTAAGATTSLTQNPASAAGVQQTATSDQTQQNETGSTSRPNTSAGTDGSPESGDAELSRAIEAYSAVAPTDPEGTGTASEDTKDAHAEELRKIANDLKSLAARIKALAKRDDKEAKDELEKAEKELQDGTDALNEFSVKQQSAQGSLAPSLGASEGDTAAPSTVTVATLSPVLVPVTISIIA